MIGEVIMEEYLPIGTIVILKDSNQKIMITGYFSSENNKLFYEYRGVSYPEGILELNKGFLFNHKSIKKVVFLGMIDEEYKEYSKKIMNLSKKYTDIMLKVSTKVLSNVLDGGKNGRLK